ncbi:hypothetical protein KAW33_11705 [Lacticaseibacillus rhamnosus]|uniref:hypothetical protein n=1 Tax=Lacticaseibacillus rhamnosus TaxID=47715 RepID=UPI001BAE3B67|nr:hypothetical protein [Lacticaseibacillus rhamnosus]QUH16697.1 hypothetical protein KAW33_11705 [Lacticaseibacillus rhamnosus]
MKRRTLFSIIVVTLTAGCFTLFYGMHSMWTDTQSAQAVQAATEEVDTLFKDKAHQLPADQLSQEKIEAVATKLHAARQKLTEPEYAAKLASAQADVDAAKHMLTVKKAVAQTTTNLSDLNTLTSDSQQALSELATQKPEFVQAYQKRVAQLSDQEAAVAKIASLFDDPDFKEPKVGLSASQVQTALAALEHVNNQQFADQMLPIIATAQQAATDDQTTSEASSSESSTSGESSSASRASTSSTPSASTSSQESASSSASNNESEQCQSVPSNSAASSASSSGQLP